MNLLLLESNLQKATSITEEIVKQLGIKVQLCETGKRAVELLKSEKIDIIISRNILDEDAQGYKEEGAKAIANFLYDKVEKIPFLVLGDFEFVGVEFTVIPEKSRINQVISTIKKELQLTKDELEDLRLPDYVPIPIHHLFLLQKVNCDIYIRIGSEKSEKEQYVKRINANDEFDRTVLARYKKSGLKNFYVQKNDKKVFYDFLFDKSIRALLDSDLTFYEYLAKMDDALNLIQDRVLDNRYDGFFQALIRNAIDHTIDVVRSVFAEDLLGELLNSEVSFYTKKFVLIVFFACKTYDHIEDALDTTFEDGIREIAFAAFFHDLLIQDEDLQKIESKTEVHEASLSEDQKRLVNKHAVEISLFVQNCDIFPRELEKTILQHHGTKAGDGFVDNYSSSIAQLSIVFIVIRRFTSTYIDFRERDLKDVDVIQALDGVFTLPTYRRIFEVLKSALHILSYKL